MSLSETTVVDKIEVLEQGVVQVRKASRVLRDGVQIAEAFERLVIHPGEDYSTQDDKVKAICQLIHTPEVVAAYEAQMAEQQANSDIKIVGQ